MKTIRMRIQKFSRPGVILMAAAVAIITSMVVANATQTITTPNAAFFSYSLAAGAYSAAITPASNRPVLVMGCTNTTGAVGQVSLQNIPSSGMHWVGLESETPAAIASGNSGTGGNHIVWIEYNHTVDIQTASINTIRVHNGNASTEAVTVTLIW